MDDLTIIIWVFVAILFAILIGLIAGHNEKKDKRGTVNRQKVTSRPDLIQDDVVTVKLVEDKLSFFQIKTAPIYKVGQ